MANTLYPKFKEALLNGTSGVDMSAGTVVAILVDADTYTYSAAHEFLSSVSGIVGAAQTLTGKTFTDGTFDSDDVTWPSVTGAESEAVILALDTGNDATSRLIAYIDSGQTGLPVTPNGGDIIYTVGAAGWFYL